MEATLKMKEVMELLTNRYTNELANMKNVDVTFEVQNKDHSYHDWDGSSDSYTTKDIQAIITYDKVINGLILKCKVVKEQDELAKDLVDEIRKITDEYKINFVSFPEFKTLSINENDNLTINLDELSKEKRLVQKA